MPRPDPHPYDRLTPDVIIAAVESLGRDSDRRILALNSYENRVYQVGMRAGRAADREVLSARPLDRCRDS